NTCELRGHDLTSGIFTVAADVYTTVVSTTHVAAAEPTTPVAACHSKTAGQGERDADRQNQGKKPTNPGGQRPIDRRKRHELTVVHPWRLVKGGLSGLLPTQRRRIERGALDPKSTPPPIPSWISPRSLPSGSSSPRTMGWHACPDPSRR